ncbi:MAG: hypothetical protein JNL57_03150 [Bacteroidetes bacterium]|nr:hypothetical protein [Bacteroidota bacterium]
MKRERKNTELFHLTPSEYQALGVRSRAKILEWKGEKLIGPVTGQDCDYSLYSLYRFLIEKIEKVDGTLMDLRILHTTQHLHRYARSIRIELDDGKLVVQKRQDDG